jgi:hypothetical protein
MSIFSTVGNWWSNTVKPFLARVSPLGNPLIAQIVLYIMIALFFGALVTHCGKAKAAELDIMAGSTFVRGPTGVLGMNLRFPQIVANYADLSVGFDLIGSSNWCKSGLTGPQCYNNNQAVIHAQVVAPLKYGIELGIGVAHLQHEDNLNCGSVDFSLSLQHQVWKTKYPNLYWRYQHFSSAGTCSPNEGRDMFLLAWRFN